MQLNHRFLILVLAFAILCVRFVYADDMDDVSPTGFNVGVGAWISPNFSGLSKSTGGTEMSLNHNLGFTTQTLIVPELSYRWAHGQILTFNYQSYNQTAITNLNVPESFQGITFAAGARAMSTTKLQWSNVNYELPVVYDHFPPHNYFLNAVAGIRFLNGSFTMSDAFGNTGTHSYFSTPLPEVGIHGRYRVHGGTDVELKLTGFRVGFVDSTTWLYDIEAGVNQKLFDLLTLTGKYRFSTFYDVDGNNNVFQYRFYGPEVDASAHF